jgi:alpha-ketoglutarate-dependent taurine dioxygenase
VTEFVIDEIRPEFGAEVRGLDIHNKLNDDDRRRLREAFDNRGALLFRDVEVTADDQMALAGILVGGDVPSDRTGLDRFAHLYPTNVSNRDENGNAPFGSLLFHSDMMWNENPMELLSLYGIDVEQPSVPTIFCSTAGAWERLPDDLRARVEGLSAVHVTGQQQRGDNTKELLNPIRTEMRSTTKPIGLNHPRTGRTILYVSQMMTSNVAGLPSEESEELLQTLFSYLYDPAHSWQHDWRTGDLVLWDNLAVQHGRPNVSLEGPARTLRKVIAPVPRKSVIVTETPRFSQVG